MSKAVTPGSKSTGTLSRYDAIAKTGKSPRGRPPKLPRKTATKTHTNHANTHKGIKRSAVMDDVSVNESLSSSPRKSSRLATRKGGPCHLRLAGYICTCCDDEDSSDDESTSGEKAPSRSISIQGKDNQIDDTCTTPKRGRGRPRKQVVEEGTDMDKACMKNSVNSPVVVKTPGMDSSSHGLTEKRGRGRPRKQLPEENQSVKDDPLMDNSEMNISGSCDENDTYLTTPIISSISEKVGRGRPRKQTVETDNIPASYNEKACSTDETDFGIITSKAADSVVQKRGRGRPRKQTSESPVGHSIITNISKNRARQQKIDTDSTNTILSKSLGPKRSETEVNNQGANQTDNVITIIYSENSNKEEESPHGQEKVCDTIEDSKVMNQDNDSPQNVVDKPVAHDVDSDPQPKFIIPPTLVAAQTTAKEKEPSQSSGTPGAESVILQDNATPTSVSSTETDQDVLNSNENKQLLLEVLKKRLLQAKEPEIDLPGEMPEVFPAVAAVVSKCFPFMASEWSSTLQLIADKAKVSFVLTEDMVVAHGQWSAITEARQLLQEVLHKHQDGEGGIRLIQDSSGNLAIEFDQSGNIDDAREIELQEGGDDLIPGMGTVPPLGENPLQDQVGKKSDSGEALPAATKTLYRKSCSFVKDPESANFECDICGYMSTLHGYKKHKLRHHNDQLYQCEVCRKTFGIRYDMRRHRMCHFDEEGYLQPDAVALWNQNNPGKQPIKLQNVEKNFLPNGVEITAKPTKNKDHNDEQFIQEYKSNDPSTCSKKDDDCELTTETPVSKGVFSPENLVSEENDGGDELGTESPVSTENVDGSLSNIEDFVFKEKTDGGELGEKSLTSKEKVGGSLLNSDGSVSIEKVESSREGSAFKEKGHDGDVGTKSLISTETVDGGKLSKESFVSGIEEVDGSLLVTGSSLCKENKNVDCLQETSVSKDSEKGQDDSQTAVVAVVSNQKEDLDHSQDIVMSSDEKDENSGKETTSPQGGYDNDTQITMETSSVKSENNEDVHETDTETRVSKEKKDDKNDDSHVDPLAIQIIDVEKHFASFPEKRVTRGKKFKSEIYLGPGLCITILGRTMRMNSSL